jgi:hypothetical protein
MRSRRTRISTLDTSRAAAFAKSFSTPVERAKLYMACQDVSTPTPYRGLWDTAQGITRQLGVTALWRGHTTVLIRYIPSQVLNFVAFCELARRLGLQDQLPGRRHAAEGTPSTTLHPVLSAAAAGAAAGACTLALIYPFSVPRAALVADRVKAAAQTKEHTGGVRGLLAEVRGTAGCRQRGCRQRGRSGASLVAALADH